MKRNIYVIIVVLSTMVGLDSCKKFLDAKPDKKLVVPSTLNDLQALLDYYPKMNNKDITSLEISSDDYYLTNADWSALAENYRRTYIWEKDHLFKLGYNDWFNSYYIIYTANTVLNGIGKINRGQNKSSWDNIKGQALFFRAKTFLHAAFAWAKAYDGETANTDLGLPLRLSADFNKPSVRSSVQETYDRIIVDLKEAIALLPVISLHKMRPSKLAAYSMLARAYLSMRLYKQAELYADSSLQLYSKLMNYNELNTSASYPIPQFNDEVIWECNMGTPPPLNNSRAKIDSTLYNSYAQHDLRKTIFFKENSDGSHRFRGSYEHRVVLFSGIATDEVYLIRAECRCRLGNIAAAMNDLNKLLNTRWENGTYIPLSTTDPDNALHEILAERRKELLMRGLRWMDVKRLNKENADLILTRIINGHTYTLPPNDVKYALPIPEDVIGMTGMTQNER